MSVENSIDMSKVLLSTHKQAESKVMVLEGYSPEHVSESLNAFLEEEGVYYEVTNPNIEENIPIQLKNSKFSKLFEPITNLFSLPNYSELDPTPFLAPFFMLFFGLCLMLSLLFFCCVFFVCFVILLFSVVVVFSVFLLFFVGCLCNFGFGCFACVFCVVFVIVGVCFCWF